MRFLVNGSIAYDVLLQYDGSFAEVIHAADLEKLSVSFYAPGYQRFPGGTGANIAWYLRILKQDVSLIGSVGKDGDEYLSMLKKAGVDVKFVDRNQDAVTATAMIGTDTHERQIAFFHPGADAVGTLPDSFKKGMFHHAIVSPRNPQLNLDLASRLERDGVPYFFDPGQVAHAFGKDEFRRAIKASKGLIVNEFEWGITQEKTEWTQKDIVEACGLLVMTRGEEGLIIADRLQEHGIAAAKPTKFTNPTGAGDALRAGLMAGMGAGWSLEDSGRLGAVMGSFAVECMGTLAMDLSIKQIAERFELTYGKPMPKLS